MSSNKTKEGLIAEIEDLRSRLAQLEQHPNPPPSRQSETPTKSASGAQQALADSELRLAEILDVAQEAIVSVDENQKIGLFNKGAERIFGFSQEETIGQSLEILLPETAHAAHRRHLERFSNGSVGSEEMNERGEIFGRRKNGELFPAEASISKVEIAGKQVFTAFLRDITEQKKILADLYLHSEVIRNMVGGVVLARIEDGVIVFTNPKFEEMFGYEPGELLGENMAALLDPGVVQKGNRSMEQHIEGVIESVEENAWWQGEARNVRKDGTSMWSSAYVSELDHPQFGRVWLSVQHDITAQKRVEDQLRQAQKIQALGTLAGGVAHDFNNMLTPILGFSEILMENPDAREDDRAYANMIFRSAQRAKDLVSQILLFSRDGKTEQKIIDLCPFTLELVEFVRSTLPKTVAISCEISADSAPVLCDSSQIHQVLVNLCVNAQQAIPGHGEIKIALDTVELHDFKCFIGKMLSGKHARIAVIDDGIGMDEEMMGQIFDPFYTTKAVGEGTGLGLAIVFGIIQKHEGGIVVSSESGRGSAFEIFLPVVEDTVEKLPSFPDRTRRMGTENILFVDDEEAIRDLAIVSLQRLGYTVTVASDGQQALEIFSENPEHFSLVVTDQTMPNMTGDVLARELLKIRPNAPIILCTGHSTVISPDSSEAVGIRRFLYKPISPRELGWVVREVLDSTKDAVE